MIKVSYNRCKDIHKFGNKYLPSAYKTQVVFRSHFSGEKLRLIVREIRYIQNEMRPTIGYVYENEDELAMLHLFCMRNCYISVERGNTFGDKIFV